MINRKIFFDTIKPILFRGRYTPSQVAGIDAILDKFEGFDPRWTAYALATAYHETGGKMTAVVENLNYSAKGLRATFPRYFSISDAARYARNPEAIANRAYANRMGNGPESSGDGFTFRGRGICQCTGRDNYRKYCIEDDPDKALDPVFSVHMLFDGMTEGKYTGKALSDYFNECTTDWVGARRIINGQDRAKKIAGEAEAFYAAIRAALS